VAPVAARLRNQEEKSVWLADVRTVTAVTVRFSALRYDEAHCDEVHSSCSVLQSFANHFGGCLMSMYARGSDTFALIVFGLPPVVVENLSLLATNMALELLQTFRRGTTYVDVSAGVATGRVVGGSAGCRSRHSHVLFGAVVVDSEQMAIAATPQTVVVCDSTWAGLQNFNRSPSTRASCWIVSRRRDSKQNQALPMSTAIVERMEYDAHAATLSTLLDETALFVASGTARLVIVEGVVGVGKHRAMTSYLRALQGTDFCAGGSMPLVLESHGEISELNTPFFVWRGIFAQLIAAAVGDADADENIHLRDVIDVCPVVAQIVNEETPAVLQVLGTVLPVLVQSTPPHSSAGAVDEETYRQAACVLFSLLLELVADASKVIVLGGCSCFDQQSWDLVVNLHKRAPTVMLVLFARPPEGRTNGESEHRALIADANVLVLKLLPWSREHICKLVCAVTHTVALDDAVADFICDRANGNPFFATELAVAMLDSGRVSVQSLPGAPAAAASAHSHSLLMSASAAAALHVDAGSAADAGAGLLALVTPDALVRGAMPFPTTMHGIIQKRVDALSAMQQLVLRVAATIGNVFERQLLYDVVPLKVGVDVRMIVSQLHDLGFFQAATVNSKAFRLPGSSSNARPSLVVLNDGQLASVAGDMIMVASAEHQTVTDDEGADADDADDDGTFSSTGSYSDDGEIAENDEFGGVDNSGSSALSGKSGSTGSGGSGLEIAQSGANPRLNTVSDSGARTSRRQSDGLPITISRTTLRLRSNTNQSTHSGSSLGDDDDDDDDVDDNTDTSPHSRVVSGEDAAVGSEDEYVPRSANTAAEFRSTLADLTAAEGTRSIPRFRATVSDLSSMLRPPRRRRRVARKQRSWNNSDAAQKEASAAAAAGNDMVSADSTDSTSTSSNRTVAAMAARTAATATAAAAAAAAVATAAAATPPTTAAVPATTIARLSDAPLTPSRLNASGSISGSYRQQCGFDEPAPAPAPAPAAPSSRRDSPMMMVSAPLPNVSPLSLMSASLSGGDDAPISTSAAAFGVRETGMAPKFRGGGGDEHEMLQFADFALQESVYEMILPSQRRQLHVSIGEWYENRHRDNCDNYLALLAHHYSAAERAADIGDAQSGPLVQKAIFFMERAAQWCSSKSLYESATDFYSSLLRIARDRPNAVERVSVIEWACLAARALARRGDLKRCGEMCKLAIDTGRFDTPDTSTFTKLYRRIVPARLRGSGSGATASSGSGGGGKSMSVTPSSENNDTKVHALMVSVFVTQSFLHSFAHEGALAVEAATQALTSAEKCGDPVQLADVLGMLSVARSNVGDVGGALAARGRALSCLQVVQERHQARVSTSSDVTFDGHSLAAQLGRVFLTIGVTLTACGHLASALKDLAPVSRHTHIPEAAKAVAAEAWVCSLLGRFSEASMLSERALLLSPNDLVMRRWCFQRAVYLSLLGCPDVAHAVLEQEQTHDPLLRDLPSEVARVLAGGAASTPASSLMSFERLAFIGPAAIVSFCQARFDVCAAYVLIGSAHVADLTQCASLPGALSLMSLADAAVRLAERLLHVPSSCKLLTPAGAVAQAEIIVRRFRLAPQRVMRGWQRMFDGYLALFQKKLSTAINVWSDCITEAKRTLPPVADVPVPTTALERPLAAATAAAAAAAGGGGSSLPRAASFSNDEATDDDLEDEMSFNALSTRSLSTRSLPSHSHESLAKALTRTTSLRRASSIVDLLNGSSGGEQPRSGSLRSSLASDDSPSNSDARSDSPVLRIGGVVADAVDSSVPGESAASVDRQRYQLARLYDAIGRHMETRKKAQLAAVRRRRVQYLTMARRCYAEVGAETEHRAIVELLEKISKASDDADMSPAAALYWVQHAGNISKTN
jgi:tetratricopeptide (TPR) repeat protein